MATIKNFQLQGYLQTAEEIERIARAAAADYLAATKIIKAQMREIYARYLAGVKPEDFYNTLLQYNRLTNMLDEMREQYIKYAKMAGGKIAAASEMAITNNFYRQRFTLSFIDQPIDLRFGIVNPWIVEASVYGTPAAWQKIQSDAIKRIYGNPTLYMRKGTLTELLVKNRIEDLAKIRQTLITDLITGKTFRESSSNIANIIGTTFKKDGVRHATGAMADAMSIVRTEGIRNMNAGDLASTNMARADGMDLDRFWDATLDGKTRPAHGNADGQKENDDGQFYVGGENLPYPASGAKASNNVRCRCSVITLMPDMSPQIRSGTNPFTGKDEVFTYKTYDEWMVSHGMKQNPTGKWIIKK